MDAKKSTFSITAVLAILAAAYLAWPQFANTPVSPAPPLETDGSPIVTVITTELSSAAKIGETAFNGKWASCHGVNAVGKEGAGPPLIHKIYEPSHHGDMAFQMAVQNGVRSHHWPFGDMPSVEGVTSGDVKNIIAFVRELQRANGIN